MKLVYPDTNILIYLIENRQGYAHKIRHRMYPMYEELPIFVFSELTRMECRVHPLRTQNEPILKAYDMLFSNSLYRFSALTRETFDIATRLRTEYNLKTPDALHLAVAIHTNCDEFWTNDYHLAKAAENHIEIIPFDADE
jgi:predicted nucleic acid-binding protein